MESFLPIYLSSEQYSVFQAGKEAIATSHQGEHYISEDASDEEILEKFMMPLLIPLSFLKEIDQRKNMIFYIIQKKDEKQNK